MKTKISGMILLLLSLTGCVKETLDKCPEGNVRINVSAEKFQTNSSEATQDIEEQIGKRIDFLHCILYQGNNYVLDTVIENTTGVKGAYLPIDFPKLPFGNYDLIIIGNCSPEVMKGDFHRRGGMNLLYLGTDETDDMFASLLSFTVDCDCTLEFYTKLRRLLGVVRCETKGLLAEVSEWEVIFHNVNSQLGNGGIYSQPIRISKRVPVDRQRANSPQSLLLGIFPTMTGHPASYELKLYTPSQTEAVFSKMMSTEVNIFRNQLVELISDFSDGEVHFSIRMNTRWEDYTPGGDVEIN